MQTSLGEWLQQLGLAEYYDALSSQGFATIEEVREITWEDLEEIGINKLGRYWPLFPTPSPAVSLPLVGWPVLLG